MQIPYNSILSGNFPLQASHRFQELLVNSKYIAVLRQVCHTSKSPQAPINTTQHLSLTAPFIWCLASRTRSKLPGKVHSFQLFDSTRHSATTHLPPDDSNTLHSNAPSTLSNNCQHFTPRDNSRRASSQPCLPPHPKKLTTGPRTAPRPRIPTHTNTTPRRKASWSTNTFETKETIEAMR